jgi:phage FluMu protein Com
MELKKKYKLILFSSLFFGFVAIIGLVNEKYILASVWGIAFLLHGIAFMKLKCPRCGEPILKRRMKFLIRTNVYSIFLPKNCPSCHSPLN